MKKLCILTAVAIALAIPNHGNGQAATRLVGTWKLVAVSSWTETDKGEKEHFNKYGYGPHPKGFLTYTADGRMMGIISEDGRKPLSIPDRVSAPAGERAAAYANFLAYAGRYSVNGNKVTHDVEISSLQNELNTDKMRVMRFEGKRLILQTTPALRGGVREIHELVWEPVR